MIENYNTANVFNQLTLYFIGMYRISSFCLTLAGNTPDLLYF